MGWIRLGVRKQTPDGETRRLRSVPPNVAFSSSVHLLRQAAVARPEVFSANFAPTVSAARR